MEEHQIEELRAAQQQPELVGKFDQMHQLLRDMRIAEDEQAALELERRCIASALPADYIPPGCKT